MQHLAWLLAFVNIEGEVEVKLKAEALPFWDSLAPDWNTKESQSEWAIEPTFEHVQAFSDGLGWHWRDSSKGIEAAHGVTAVG